MGSAYFSSFDCKVNQSGIQPPLQWEAWVPCRAVLILRETLDRFPQASVVNSNKKEFFMGSKRYLLLHPSKMVLVSR